MFEHELNEYKSVQVTRILHDFYDSDPKRGFYGGGGLDARIGPQPTIWAQRIAGEGPAGARPSRNACANFRARCRWPVTARRFRSRPTTSRSIPS